MFFLTPKFLKHAKLLHKGVTRFIHYKRDLLPQQKLDEIAKLRSELEAAIKARDEKRLKALHEEINRSCDRALPEGKAGWLDEHVEVVFVSLVIALGIRTYIAQPFQIPTGSMQPTLSGITAERTEADATPGLMDKFLGFFQSKSYVNAVSDHEGDLVPLKYGNDGRGHSTADRCSSANDGGSTRDRGTLYSVQSKRASSAVLRVWQSKPSRLQRGRNPRRRKDYPRSSRQSCPVFKSNNSSELIGNLRQVGLPFMRGPLFTLCRLR